jgi:hypothetical protein
MSKKSIKLSRRVMRKEESKIKCEGLDQFLIYSNSKPLLKRIVFAVRIIFKATIK